MTNVDRNVPIPDTNSGMGRPRKYPFNTMDVGDSIFYPDEPAGSQSKQCIAARNHGIRHGVSFACPSPRS